MSGEWKPPPSSPLLPPIHRWRNRRYTWDWPYLQWNPKTRIAIIYVHAPCDVPSYMIRSASRYNDSKSWRTICNIGVSALRLGRGVRATVPYWQHLGIVSRCMHDYFMFKSRAFYPFRWTAWRDTSSRVCLYILHVVRAQTWFYWCVKWGEGGPATPGPPFEAAASTRAARNWALFRVCGTARGGDNER